MAQHSGVIKLGSHSEAVNSSQFFIYIKELLQNKGAPLVTTIINASSDRYLETTRCLTKIVRKLSEGVIKKSH